MSAVLRIALSAFSFVPLQRVLNIIGGSVALLALLWQLVAPTMSPVAAFFKAMGVLLIVITPLFGGGPALRYTSTASVLHLRPHGRLRMLLGAGLGITLVAALAAFPFAVDQLLAAREGAPPMDVPVSLLFSAVWICTALAWLGMFAAMGGRRPMLPFLFVIPAVAGPLVRHLESVRFGLQGAALTALAACAAFALWYARTDVVRRPGVDRNSVPWGLGRIAARAEARPLPSRAGVLRQYLQGTASLTSSALSGVLVVAMLGVCALIPRLAEARSAGPAPFMLLVLASLGFGFIAATLGHMLARRARLLWLRAGLDRTALFVLAERQGLASTAVTFSIPMVVLIGAGIIRQPSFAGALLAFGLVSIAAVLCLFYAGLATTRNWDAADIAVMACMVVLQVMVIILARPGAQNSIQWALGFTAALSVFALVLRDHAKHRWLQLDWRVMRMLQVRR